MASVCSMDSDFIERIERIKLTSEEGEAIAVRPVQRARTLEEHSLSVIGKFLTVRPFNQRAAKDLLRSVWKMGNDLKMVDVGGGLIQFKFAMESQLRWVMNNGPWSFDDHLLVLRRWEKGMTARSVSFPVLPIWVQVWGLPFDLINEEAGQDIGSSLGHVVEVDSKAIASDQARFLRIRIEIPLTKPLRRGAPIVSPEGDEVRVAFKYERLVGLCYNCGMLGHEIRECSKEKSMEGGELPYGEWMRAGNRRKIDGAGRKPSSPPCRRETQIDRSRARGPPHLEPKQGVNSGVNAQYGQPKNQGIETEMTVNAETVVINTVEAENNSSIINPEILGINLISVPIEYVIEEGFVTEVTTSTTHASFNAAHDTTKASDSARDSGKTGKEK